MANIYLFFDKRGDRKDGCGTVKLALRHNGRTVFRSLEIRIHESQWDVVTSQVKGRADKKFLNVQIRKTFADCVVGLSRVEKRKDFESLTAEEVLKMVARGADTMDDPEDLDYVLPVYNEYITLCRKSSTAQVYRSSLRNLKEYCEDIDSLRFKDINGAWLKKYQSWLLGERGMEVNGANVYLRNLRTIFNYALNNQFTKAHYPFREIDMSTTEPDKREIPYSKFIDFLSFPAPDYRAFYRDLFILSFYLCGIRPVDLLHVKKSQVVDGRLVYCPEKLNGRTRLSIKIEPEAWEIIHRYEGTEYLLCVMERRKDYKTFLKHCNAALRAIGEDTIVQRTGRKGTPYTTVKHNGIIPYISIYYARTCWATYQYNVLDCSMDTISQGLGHKSGLRVTNLYVKRNAERVDRANRQLIDRVKADMQGSSEKETASA